MKSKSKSRALLHLTNRIRKSNDQTACCCNRRTVRRCRQRVRRRQERRHEEADRRRVQEGDGSQEGNGGLHEEGRKEGREEVNKGIVAVSSRAWQADWPPFFHLAVQFRC